MRYTVEKQVFEMFPRFRRGVVIATEVNNTSHDAVVDRLLGDAIAGIPSTASTIEQQRIDVWNDAYRRLGLNPSKFTPSVSFLLNQVRRGRPPKSINTLVDLFNTVSLKLQIPCGGDDLAATEGGDLCLGFATGTETFAPLFRPEAIENPSPDELIYYTPQTQRVLCRRWTWRNSDFSKLTPATRAAAVNLDFMTPPFDDIEIDKAIDELANLISTFCGGKIDTHFLKPTAPSFEFDLITASR